MKVKYCLLCIIFYSLLLPLTSCEDVHTPIVPDNPIPEVKPNPVIPTPLPPSEDDKQDDIIKSLQLLPLARGFHKINEDIPNDGAPVEIENKDEEEPQYTKVNGVPGRWIVKRKKYRLTQSFDEAILLNPNVDIMYPGCVIAGESIYDNTYMPLNGITTKPMTISINKVPENVDDIENMVVETEPDMRMSDYRKIFAKWSKIKYTTSASTALFSLDVVTNDKDLKNKIGLALGVTDLFRISGNFNFDFKSTKNHIFCKYIQNSYSVTANIPKKGTIFAENSPQYYGSSQPVYISNINYGRIAFISIETDYKLTDIKAAMDFALNEKATNGKVDFSIEAKNNYEKILNDQKVSFVVIGGKHSDQNKLMEGTLASLMEFMKTEPEMQEMMPVSFSLRYVMDNSLAKVVSQTEYDLIERIFIPEFKDVTIELAAIGISCEGEPDRKNEVTGRSWLSYSNLPKVEINGSDKTNMFFNWTQWKEFKESKSFHNIDNGSKYFKFIVPKGKNSLEMLNQVVTFNTDLKDNGAITKNFGLGKYTISLADLLKKAYSDDKTFVVTAQNYKHIARVRFQVRSAYYTSKNGDKVNASIMSYSGKS